MSNLVFKQPEAIKPDYNFNFCPGCDHGVAIRLVAEAIDELGVREKALMAASVGCSVFGYDYFNVDVAESPHGRAPAVATGMKRAMPDHVVYTYQGDGDAASIGLTELVHSAVRGERITVFCINNTNFGMTGGQAGPTTIPGQKTTTTPYGKDTHEVGFPMKIAETIALCQGAAFVARGSLDSPGAIRNAKKLVKRAFEVQIEDLGFGFVELLSCCPTNWHKHPRESHKWVKNVLYPVFPLGVLKNTTAE